MNELATVSPIYANFPQGFKAVSGIQYMQFVYAVVTSQYPPLQCWSVQSQVEKSQAKTAPFMLRVRNEVTLKAPPEAILFCEGNALPVLNVAGI